MESYNIKQSRKKTETFRFFRLRLHCVDNSDYESGPIFNFSQVINDVATPLTTPTPTTPQAKLNLASRKKSTITYLHNIIFLVFLPFDTVWTRQILYDVTHCRGDKEGLPCVLSFVTSLLLKVNL